MLHERHPRRDLYRAPCLMVRDLPISGKPTYLRFVRRRFFCDDCHRAFSESLGFVDERRYYTQESQSHSLVVRLIHSLDRAYHQRYMKQGSERNTEYAYYLFAACIN